MSGGYHIAHPGQPSPEEWLQAMPVEAIRQIVEDLTKQAHLVTTDLARWREVLKLKEEWDGSHAGEPSRPLSVTQMTEAPIDALRRGSA